MGRAALQHVQTKDSHGATTTHALWLWQGKHYRLSRDSYVKRAIGAGAYINVQTGDVLTEGNNYEPLYS